MAARDWSQPKPVEQDGPESPEVVAAAESFEQFFVREYRQVVGLAAVLSGSRAAAEDIAQDAFEAAHRRWATVSAYDDPGAWVRRVAANLAVSAIRRRSRELRALIRLGGRREPSATMPEAAEEFWAAVRSLSARQAQCVALRYLEDRSVGEIARLLGLEESTVRVHLHNGRVALARLLEEPPEGDK